MQGPNRTKRKAASTAPLAKGAEYLMLADGYFPGYGIAAKDTRLFYDGTPGKHMQPLNAAAEKAYNDMADAKKLPRYGDAAATAPQPLVVDVPSQPGQPPTDHEKALELAKQVEEAQAAAKAEKAKPRPV